MAAQNKTTAVHFSLIFFVMLSVVLGVVSYLFYSDYRDQQAQSAKNQQELNAASSSNKRYQEEVDALKKTIGIDRPEVGVAQPGENTVLSQSSSAIQTLGTNPAAPSFLVALQDLRTELNNRTVELAQRQGTIADLQAQVEALNKQYSEVAKQHDDKRVATETDLAGQQDQFAESIAAKDREIGQLREVTSNLQTELEQTKQQMSAQVAKIEEDNRLLLAQNRILRTENETIKGESYEVADGAIVRVDQVGRNVWINLGSDEGLKPRITFSVYAKNNRGIGRDAPGGGRPEDIKGSIEVTRIINDHMAEARILSDDSGKPISPGDPIYTPLWGAGRTEKFAFAGMIDVDRDGNYTGDRDRLHELVEAAGAQISSEITDAGERLGNRIDEQTRFLVLGTIPEWQNEPDPKRKAELKSMRERFTEMQSEAEMSGVRIVNLNTFLDYIGYVPQQKRWVPGESMDWNLDAGGRKAATPSSSGNASGLFDTSRRRPNPSGTTSQKFNGQN